MAISSLTFTTVSLLLEKTFSTVASALDSISILAYRGSGRLERAMVLAYRGTGRLETNQLGFYRGSERGLQAA